MKELGFFMDNLGNTIYFGEWKEQYDKNNRHEIHSFSFEDEVEANPLFQILHLQYDKEMGLYGKAIAFALQGMILLQNTTSRGNSSFIMYSPKNLTEEQKKSLTDLYSILSSFNDATIIMPDSIYIKDEDKIKNLDDYYELNSIKKENRSK